MGSLSDPKWHIHQTSGAMNMSTRAILVAAVLLGTTAASFPSAAAPINSSVNIDVRPDHLAEGLEVLKDYLHKAKDDPDLTNVRLDQQLDPPNHFILTQTMADRAVYDKHVQADYVRKFRDSLYAHLGSPWDERLFHDVSP
jgi:quinol monooxygenase YgiN